MKNMAQIESRLCREVERGMVPCGDILTASLHGIPIVLAPMYSIRANVQPIGAVWKEADSTFFASPVNAPNELRMETSLEAAIAWLFGRQGISCGEQE